MKVQIYSDDGKPIEATGEPGELVATAPFPSQPAFFWGDDGGKRYKAAYFETFPGTVSFSIYQCGKKGQLKTDFPQVFGIKETTFVWTLQLKASSFSVEATVSSTLQVRAVLYHGPHSRG
jgi:hypothetical protein